MKVGASAPYFIKFGKSVVGFGRWSRATFNWRTNQAEAWQTSPFAKDFFDSDSDSSLDGPYLSLSTRYLFSKVKGRFIIANELFSAYTSKQ